MTAIQDTSAVVAPKKEKVGRLFPLDLMEWSGHPACLYLSDFRISGSKPFGGCTPIYSWQVRETQLKEILKVAHARGATSISIEVFKHTNNHYAVYLDNVLLEGPRADSRGARPRRVGSVVVYLNRELRLSEFGRAYKSLELPAA